MMTLWPQYPQSQIHKCPSFRGRKYCTFSFLISATYLPLTSVALQKVKGTCFASLILFRQVETCSATHAPMKCLRLPQHARLKMLYVFMKIDIYFVHLWLYCRAVICGFCVFLYCTCKETRGGQTHCTRKKFYFHALPYFMMSQWRGTYHGGHLPVLPLSFSCSREVCFVIRGFDF